MRLRTKAVFDGGQFLIPAKFWRGVTAADMTWICDHDRLPDKHKQRLFRLMGKPVPAGPVRIMCWQPDLDQLLEDLQVESDMLMRRKSPHSLEDCRWRGSTQRSSGPNTGVGAMKRSIATV